VTCAWLYRMTAKSSQSGRGFRKLRKERADPEPCAKRTATICPGWLTSRKREGEFQRAAMPPSRNWPQRGKGNSHPVRNGPKPGDWRLGQNSPGNNCTEWVDVCPVLRLWRTTRSRHPHVRLWNRQNNARLSKATGLAAANPPWSASDSSPVWRSPK